MTATRRILKGLGIAALTTTALTGLALALLPTPLGEAAAERLANRFLDTADGGARLSGLTIGWNGSIGLDRLELTDPVGTYGEIENIGIVWSPLALFGLSLNIDSVSAQRVALQRRPALPETASDDQQDGFKPPLRRITLGRLNIAEADLGEDVAGAPMRFSVRGQASASGPADSVNASLNIERTDGIRGAISGQLAYVSQSGALTLSLRASEPRGGLVARLAGIEGLPAVDLNLDGSGPLDNWAANLAIALDGQRTVTGAAQLARTDAGRELKLALTGQLEPLVPPAASALAAGDTQADLSLMMSQDYKPLSASLAVTTRTLQANASGSLDPVSGALSAKTDARIAAGGDALLALEADGQRYIMQALSLTGNVSGSLAKADWNLNLQGDRLSAPQGALERLQLSATGIGADLKDEFRLPFSARLTLGGLQPADASLSSLAGDSSLEVVGQLLGNQKQISIGRGTLSAPGVQIRLQEGVIAQSNARLAAELTLADLSRFSGMTGLATSGALAMNMVVEGNPSQQAGSIRASIAGTNVATGLEQVDRLLAGALEGQLEAGINSSGEIAFRRFALGTSALKLDGTGKLGTGGTAPTVDGEVKAVLTRVEEIDPRLTGALEASVRANGPLSGPDVSLSAKSAQLTLAGTPLTDLMLELDGKADAAAPAGALRLSGSLNGTPLTARADVSSSQGAADVRNISFVAGRNELNGALSVASLTRALETLTGELVLKGPALEDLSPLLLTQVSGTLDATARISANQSGPQVSLTASGRNVAYQDNRVGTLAINGEVFDLLSVPQARGKLEARQIMAGATAVESLTLSAESDGTRTGFTLDTRLQGADGVSATGSLTATAAGFDLALERLQGSYSGLKTTLARPARLTYEGAVARIEPLQLALGSGRLDISGTAGDRLDIKAALADVPLALGNAFAPGYGLGGTLSGTATVTGAAAAPQASWKLSGRGLTASLLTENGITSLGLDSTGAYSGNRITQTTRITGADGLALTAEGPVNLAGSGSLDIGVNGTVPLGLARVRLTEMGYRGAGTLAVSGRISGPLTNPAVNLQMQPQGLELTELATGLTLRDFAGSIGVTREQITISGLNAAISAGGRVSANGTVGLGQGLPAELAIQAVNARYSDGRVVTADLNADLRLSGPLAGTGTGGRLSGTVNISTANINIPQSLPGALSPLAVRHVNAPKPVRAQIAELQAEGGGSGGQQSSASAPIGLDITLSAPSRVFVRGRGVDAELGGTLRLTGTTANPQALGGFTLRRGLLDILTRRLTFSRGSIGFTGSLTPNLDFLAATSASSTSINVTVTGSAADPVIDLTSSPALPQDEILAQLLFDRSVTNLSPTQIAQLAAAVTSLTGGSDTGPLSQLRKSLGLDAVDVNLGGADGPSLSAGRYINENIYLGVEQGTSANSSRVKVDIDLNRNLKARGEVGADGSSKAGIFYEKEY
ncbi:translocation/assembly module TamB domain-containing protein [Pannonibacter phragmitetus]|uniref:translocation/assembly module TamB domain-containing protein n=1 Tax=Pannonibacter phragmitetus TaxID=121719 RepID=UPI000F02971E|nr:translocation/assembly module TamB domain-containing protein [Pannonibacter phragmitetus]